MFIVWAHWFKAIHFIRACIMGNLLLVVLCILLSLVIGVVFGRFVGFGLRKVLERNRYKES